MALSDSLRMMNLRNAEFWKSQKELTFNLAADPVICERAIARMRSEMDRNVPLKARMTFESALAEVVDTNKALQRQRSARGGKASKKDALQRLVEEIVERTPNINKVQLVYRLKGEDGAGIVISIDEQQEAIAGAPMIHFVEPDGKPQTAPLSGLKHRLARAKKNRSKRAHATSR